MAPAVRRSDWQVRGWWEEVCIKAGMKQWSRRAERRSQEKVNGEGEGQNHY